MKPDIVEFTESILNLKLTEFQKKLLRTYYEHKDKMTEPLYLNIRRSQKKVIVEALRVFAEGMNRALERRIQMENEDKERYQELEEQLNGALASLTKSNGSLDKLLIINDTQIDKEDETDAMERKTK